MTNEQEAQLRAFITDIARTISQHDVEYDLSTLFQKLTVTAAGNGEFDINLVTDLDDVSRIVTETVAQVQEEETGYEY